MHHMYLSVMCVMGESVTVRVYDDVIYIYIYIYINDICIYVYLYLYKKHYK